LPHLQHPRHRAVAARRQDAQVRHLDVTQEALNITQRALSVTQRTLSVTQRALSATQRALSVAQRALNVTQRALSATQRALHNPLGTTPLSGTVILAPPSGIRTRRNMRSGAATPGPGSSTTCSGGEQWLSESEPTSIILTSRAPQPSILSSLSLSRCAFACPSFSPATDAALVAAFVRCWCRPGCRFSR
jgi:hypothetical protein